MHTLLNDIELFKQNITVKRVRVGAVALRVVRTYKRSHVNHFQGSESEACPKKTRK